MHVAQFQDTHTRFLRFRGCFASPITMQSVLQATIEYIKATKLTGLCSEADLDTIIADRVQNLVMVFAKSDGNNMTESAATITLLSESNIFSEEQKKVLMKAIQSSSTSDGTKSTRGPGQTNTFFEHYMTASIYEKLRNQTEQDKIRTIVEFAQNTLGLRHPDVPTRKRIVACVVLSAGMQSSFDDLKCIYDSFSTYNVKYRKAMPHLTSSCSIFPRDPSEFMRLHPGRFAEDDMPVACRIDAAKLTHIATIVPVRKTNSMLADASKSPTDAIVLQKKTPTNAPLMQMQQCFAGMMQMIMNNQSKHTPIRFVGPSTASTDSPSSPEPSNSSQPLALPAPPTSHAPLALPAPPVLPVSPAPAPQIGCDPANDEDDDEIEDEIDRMIAKGSATSKATSKKRPSEPSAAKLPLKKPRKEADDNAFAKNNPPKFGTKLPLVFNKCRVYESPGKYRVVPFPGQSRYDKSFSFVTKSKPDVWKDVIEYCKKPSIPKDSKNAIKN